MAYRTGKIRGYGACNDNAVGLMGARQCRVNDCCPPRRQRSSHTGMYGAARELGARAALHGERLLDCEPTVEENGVSRRRRRPSPRRASRATAYSRAACSRASTGLRPATASLRGRRRRRPRTGEEARAEAPRGRMDTRGWGLTLGRYRTTAMRSAAAQYTKLALKGGPRAASYARYAIDAITESHPRAGLTDLSFRFVAGRKRSRRRSWATRPSPSSTRPSTPTGRRRRARSRTNCGTSTACSI